MKKIIAVVVLLASAGGGVWYWKFRDTPEQASEEKKGPTTATVERGPLRVVVEATGRVVPEQEVEIKCKASGEVITLPVDVSDTVKKDDVLLQLDPEDEERSVRRAEVALAVSKARLEQARLAVDIAERELATERTRATAALASAEAAAEEAESKIERARQLLEKKVVTPEDLDTAETARARALSDLESAKARITDLDTAKVRIESLRQSLAIAEAQVESDGISLDDARQRLAETTVTAPIDGVVTARNVQVGQIIASGVSNVGGGTSVMNVADLSRMYVLVAVDESDIGRVAVGQPATVTVDAWPDNVFRGEVVRVAAKGSVTSNVVTFEVKVEVNGKRRDLLKPEMTANVEITAVDREDVPLLPVRAVRRRKRERYVLLPAGSDGEPEERVVVTGESDGEKIEIVSGLSEGDVVLLPESGSQSRWRPGGGGSDDGGDAGDGKNARDASRDERRKSRMARKGMGG